MKGCVTMVQKISMCLNQWICYLNKRIQALETKSSIVYLGNWLKDVDYKIGESISYNGALYVSIKESKNKIPQEPSEFWEKIGDSSIDGGSFL